jgi:hypothetical protein
VGSVLLRFAGWPGASSCERLWHAGEKKNRQQQKQSHTADISKAHFATSSFKIGLHHRNHISFRAMTRPESPSKP